MRRYSDLVTHENERVKEFGHSDNFWLKLLPHFIKIHSAYLLTAFIPVVGRVADTNCRVNYYSADKGKQNMPGYMNKHILPSK